MTNKIAITDTDKQRQNKREQNNWQITECQLHFRSINKIHSLAFFTSFNKLASIRISSPSSPSLSSSRLEARARLKESVDRKLTRENRFRSFEQREGAPFVGRSIARTFYPSGRHFTTYLLVITRRHEIVVELIAINIWNEIERDGENIVDTLTKTR